MDRRGWIGLAWLVTGIGWLLFNVIARRDQAYTPERPGNASEEPGRALTGLLLGG